MSEHEQLSLQAPVVELLTATSGPCLSLQPVAVLTNQLGNTRFSLNREGGSLIGHWACVSEALTSPPQLECIAAASGVFPGSVSATGPSAAKSGSDTESAPASCTPIYVLKSRLPFKLSRCSEISRRLSSSQEVIKQ